MPLTRIQAETALIRRCRGKMELAGMDIFTMDGTNPDLNWPFYDALLGMGIQPADPLEISDSDLAGMEDPQEFLDRAEYRLLKDIAGNITLTDITIGPRRENLSQLAGQLDKQIDRMKLHLEQTYGVGTGSLSAGSISLDFQAKPDFDQFYSDDLG